jgi:hypothetical protein
MGEVAAEHEGIDLLHAEQNTMRPSSPCVGLTSD